MLQLWRYSKLFEVAVKNLNVTDRRFIRSPSNVASPLQTRSLSSLQDGKDLGNVASGVPGQTRESILRIAGGFSENVIGVMDFGCQRNDDQTTELRFFYDKLNGER